MTTQNISRRLALVSSKIETLDRFLIKFSETFTPPLFYHSGAEHYGFRFGAPGPKHFCFLKSIRAVSALRASVILAREGYPQELFVLLRTLAEFTTHIEFILFSLDDNGTLSEEASTYLTAFFSDFARNSDTDFGKIKLKQVTVHKTVGASLDAAQRTDSTGNYDPTQKLFSQIYRTLSNFVHGRYPEIMDLYGGDPARWHTNGMAGTPKEEEMISFLETVAGSVALTFRLMIRIFALDKLVEEDAGLIAWRDGLNPSSQERSI
jgi:hypothetical protein